MPLPDALARVLADALAPSLARWSTARERAILAEGSPFDPALRRFARDLGIVDSGGLRQLTIAPIPLPFPDPLVSFASRLGLPVFRPVGMALGRGVAVVEPLPATLRHELVHVAQYQRLGGHLAFMRRYVFECLHYGYHGAPLEIEAREGSRPA